MAIFYPPLREIRKFPQQPTAGEWAILNIFKEFDNSYEVFFQPHLNGELPDVVVLRKNHGVCIIEVKDWHLSSYTYNTEDIWTVNNAGFRTKSPIAQVEAYKENLYGYHVAGLAEETALNPKIYGVITTIVYFHQATKKEIDAFLLPHKNRRTRLLGYDELSKQKLLQAMGSYMAGSRKSKFFSSDSNEHGYNIYKQFKQALQPPEAYQKIEEITQYTPRQWEIIRKCDAGKKVKFCGVSGSGKSQVLAKIAVNAAQKTNQPIVILTFNITLTNYIRDLLRKADHAASFRQFIICHYHQYLQLFMNKNNIPEEICRKHVDTDYIEYILPDRGIAENARNPVILVDEIQDYKPIWLENIYKMLRSDGELVIAGDIRQNIYNRETDTAHMPKTTIKGRWNSLHESFRLSSDITDLANAFQKRFLSDTYGFEEIQCLHPKKPESQMRLGSLHFEDTPIHYYYVPGITAATIVEAYEKMYQQYGFHENDCCILGEKISDLQQVDAVLRSRNKRTTRTFETWETRERIYNEYKARYYPLERAAYKIKESLQKIRRSYKFGFYMNTGCIKLSTIQSFKGWEITNLILLISKPKRSDVDNKELIYTALTRCKKNLLIFNQGNAELDDFFSEYMKHSS